MKDTKDTKENQNYKLNRRARREKQNNGKNI